MKQTTFYCDRCKLEIADYKEFWASIEWTHLNRGPTRSHFDLCDSCAALVLAVIKDPAASTKGRQA
jgi:hypothetical protein